MGEAMAGKVAVVTGAGTGIGRAVATTLLKAGYRVALAGRRREALEETATLAGGESLVQPTDVADPASVAALFAAVEARWGRLDLLFNNAGLNAPGVPFDELPVEKWQEIVAVNLTGSFLCAQQAFRIMKRQSPRGGRIINNGSISAHAPRPESAPYTATKHAITGLTKSLALDGRGFGICAGQVDIGNAATPMTQRMQRGVKQATGEVKVEPTMDVQNVADAVLFMDSRTLEANVLFMTIKATEMPFEGRG